MKNTLLLILAFTFYTSFGQKRTTETTPDVPFIEVTGTATQEIEPDQFFVSITLSEKSIDNRKYSIENQEEKLGQILKTLQIDANKLTLSDLSSQIIKDKKGEIGFKQTKEFLLLLKTSSDVSKLFSALFEANIKQADVIKTSHSNMVAFSKEVRIDAIKAAKEKAEYLLEAVGNTINEPLQIIEETMNSSNYNTFRGREYANKELTETISSSEFKKIVISFSYRVKYSIK